MISLNNEYLFVKGTCNVTVRDLDGNIDYQSSNVQSNQFATSCNMNEVRAGMGNAIAIQLPSDASVTLNLTAADFSMKARAMQLGSAVTYNAVAPECESITASGATLTVSKTPAPPQGYSKCVCNISTNGVPSANAYEIDKDTKQILGFTATSGVTYTVFYFTANAAASQVIAYSQFAPAIKHVTAQMGVFSKRNTSSQNQGAQAGWLYYIVPRMQFTGKADMDGSQSSNATTDLTGTALTYEEALAVGVCTDCNLAKLAYIVYVPFDETENIIGLAVVGGAISVAASAQKQIPVKYVMENGQLVDPDYGDLTYTSASATTATVSSTGVVTGVAAGDTDVTIKITAKQSIQTVCGVTVTSA